MHIIDTDRTKLEAYAWPGGYPVIYLATDGWREEDGTLTPLSHNEEHSCCAKCAVDTAQWPDMIVIGQECYYEGPPEECEYCNGLTESAYGDPEADTESEGK